MSEEISDKPSAGAVIGIFLARKQRKQGSNSDETIIAIDLIILAHH